MSTEGLVARDVFRTFPGPDGGLPVLRGAAIDMLPGEAAAIIGPSGSGKSTFLHLLGALDKADSGTIRLDGVNPLGLDANGLADYRNRQVGFVFQDHHLLPQLTVLENVLAPAWANGGRATPEVAVRARLLLDRVGLTGRLDHFPAQLSGGERQRAAVARSLVLAPRLLLADEPTGNLDSRTASEVGALLLDLGTEKPCRLLVVTHSLELASRFPRVYRMAEGKLVPAGDGVSS